VDPERRLLVLSFCLSPFFTFSLSNSTLAFPFSFIFFFFLYATSSSFSFLLLFLFFLYIGQTHKATRTAKGRETKELTLGESCCSLILLFTDFLTEPGEGKFSLFCWTCYTWKKKTKRDLREEEGLLVGMKEMQSKKRVVENFFKLQRELLVCEECP
jgi:hypothetical protein